MEVSVEPGIMSLNAESLGGDQAEPIVLSGLDAEQVGFMNRELCIQVDGRDNIAGKLKKKDAHLLANINKGYLHRAFSVFLFNKKNQLLLQKRSSNKITFPDYVTNTCCSHPLFNQSEIDNKDFIGTKIAARRKLFHELGIPAWQLPLHKFIPMRRIHYKSPCEDGIWGEHEGESLPSPCYRG